MKKKILVIDDEEILIRSLSKLLEKVDYEVYTARNGQDAIEMIKDESFDLIVCDIRMPGINGVETIRKIREFYGSQKSNHPPNIFITGYVDHETENEAKTLNPSAYILKPFDAMELLTKINEIIK